MRVEQLMSPSVRACRPEDSLEVAARLMWDHDCGAIPVTDARRYMVGMITDRDVCMAAYTRGQRLSEIPVGTAMARTVYSCGRANSLEDAARLMRERQVRRLPVVDELGRLVGMISINDLAREAARPQRSDGGPGLIQTLAAIGKPRLPVELVSSRAMARGA